MIYIYKSRDGLYSRTLDTLLGMRYWAYDAAWPYGRFLANGWTANQAERRARRRLAIRGQQHDHEPLLVREVT